MEQKGKVIATFLVLIFIVAAFYFATKAITQYTGYAITGNAVKNTNLDSFVQCLKEKNVKVYGAYWCPHCQNQKALFGNSQSFTNNIYVECDPAGDNPQESLCQQQGIQGYPTWVISGNKYPGEQTLDKLASLSGCSLNK
jgi:thiol-disulfide isomerase/thioredoxin